MIRKILSTLVLALGITAFAQPSNDSCADAQFIATTGPDICIPTQGDLVGATDGGIVPGCAFFQGGEVWFTFVVPSTGVVVIETSADTTGGIDTGMAAYLGSCDDLELLACNDDGGEGLYSMIELSCLNPGEQVFVAVWEYGNDNQGLFNICAYQPPAGCGDINLANVTALSFSEVEVSWNTLGSGNTYYVEYGPDGFDPGTGTTVTGTVCTDGPPVLISGLTDNTAYDFYIYEDCGAGEETNTLQTGITTPAICPAVTGLTTDSVSVDFISLTWNSLNAGATYTIEYGLEGFTPGTGTQITGTTGTDGPPVDIPGLTLFTFYDFYVWEDCDGTNVSDTTSNTFNTAPGILTNDDCADATFLPVNGPNQCIPTTGFNDGATDSGVAHTCANYQGGDVWFSFIAPPGGAAFVETSNAGGFGDGGLALYSGDCDTGLELIECNDDGGEGLFSLIEAYDLTPGETYYAAVWEYGGNEEGAFNICVYEPPTCPTPGQFSFFVDSISSTDAFVAWTALNTGATYIIEYGPDGFTPGTGMTTTGVIGTDGPPAHLPGLDPSTAYDYYFQAVCSPGDSTDVLGPYGMTTLETCQTPGAFEIMADTVGFDFITISWPPYNPGATYIIEYGLVGFTPGSGTTITGTTGTDGPPVTIPGLLIGSDYDFYFQEACNATDSTQLVGPVLIETASLPPTNDDLCGSAELTVNDPFMMFTNEGATREDTEVDGSCFGGGQDPDELHSVWFHFTAPASGEVTVSTDMDDTELHDTRFAVYELNGDCSDHGNLTEIGCDEDGGDGAPFGYTSVLDLTDLTEGTDYYIQVDGWDDADGEFGIRVFENTISVEEYLVDGFSLYPNPTESQVTITAGALNGLVNIEVLDMNGRLTHAERAVLEASRPLILDLEALESGLYMVRIVNQEGFSVQRLVIE